MGKREGRSHGCDYQRKIAAMPTRVIKIQYEHSSDCPGSFDVPLKIFGSARSGESSNKEKMTQLG
jgi:hypothetical protein